MLAIDPGRFIAVLSHWRALLIEAGRLPVMGVSAAQLQSIAVPTIVIPGNDKVHNTTSAKPAHQVIPGAILHTLPIDDVDTPLVPFEQWGPYEDEITQTLAALMASSGRSRRYKASSPGKMCARPSTTTETIAPAGSITRPD